MLKDKMLLQLTVDSVPTSGFVGVNYEGIWPYSEKHTQHFEKSKIRIRNKLTNMFTAHRVPQIAAEIEGN